MFAALAVKAVDAAVLAVDADVLAVLLVVAAVVLLTVLLTGEAVLAAAGKLSRRRNSADYVFILHLTLAPAPAGSLPTAMVRMLRSSGCSCRPSEWL